jgi:DNA polymerase-1
MKKPNKYKSTAIIDADFILYIACNPNKVIENGVPKKTDGKFVYEDKTLEQAINTFESYMNDLLHLCRVDSYILCLTGKKNFRYEVDPSYKSNRVGLEKPKWFKEVRQHMIDSWEAVQVDGIEADDMVIIIRNSLENSFIVAVDKDLLNCVSGTHFDARKGQGHFVTVTEAQANFAFVKSILTGDAVDGIPNVKKGYGPKTAEKELLASTDTTLEETALNIFIRELGEEEGKNRFEKQKKLLKMLESLEDLPEGVTFEIPEPTCYDCVEAEFSDDQYRLELQNY